MYPPMEVVEETPDGATLRESYMLKPMNCPHHHKIYAARLRSYRELPLRLAEYGQVYRWEASGAVSGLARVRMLSMNDAHIYCTEGQIRDVFREVISEYDEAYRILGLKDYTIRLSRWDPDDPKGREKYVDAPDDWQRTEAIIADLLDAMEIDYEDGPGEAAFYGPKLDVMFRTITGKVEQLSTVQLDFAVPPRLGLSYIGDDGAEHVPYCIHRAPLSTHERFVALLIEHFGGAFPTWLAPVQVRVITVSEHYGDYARQLVESLRTNFVRAELASESDTVSKKIRDATTRKIPNLLIVGEHGDPTPLRRARTAHAAVRGIRGGTGEDHRDPFARVRGVGATLSRPWRAVALLDDGFGVDFRQRETAGQADVVGEDVGGFENQGVVLGRLLRIVSFRQLVHARDRLFTLGHQALVLQAQIPSVVLLLLLEPRGLCQ
ncbi:MAG: hypothetical protein J4F45_09015 [Pseudomonadales bacterium]|nr:hypothetical protein [Pseudomonadales bacterium]